MTPELKTERYMLRRFLTKDLAAFAKYRAIAEVAQYQSWSDYSYEDALRLYEGIDYNSFGAVGQWYQLAIVQSDSNILVGDLALHFVDELQVEVGFTVDPEYQRQGVAEEALQELLKYLFTHMGKHRVIAITDTLNIPSFKLLEKIGFRREAHYIQNIFFKGNWGDEYSYGMLKTEYQGILADGA